MKTPKSLEKIVLEHARRPGRRGQSRRVAARSARQEVDPFAHSDDTGGTTSFAMVNKGRVPPCPR